MPHYGQPITSAAKSDDKSSLIQNLVAEIKKLTSRVQGFEGNKGVEGLNYEDLCVQPDVELLEGYKPPKFEMLDGTGDPRVHLRIQDAKKLTSWVNMASDFMDRFRFNTENAPDVFYIQNLKKKPTETFCEYATRWRSEAAKVRQALEVEQMNRQYTAIAKPIDQLYEKLKAAGYVTPIPVVTPENPSQWINPNKTCAYHSGMKGHTIDECHSLKDKIQNLIDNKIIIAKEPAPNVRNNPLHDHKSGGIHMIEIEDDWDPKGSIGLIVEGDEPKKPEVTLNPIVVQIQPSKGDMVNVSVPLEFEAPSAKAPKPIEVEFGIPKAPIPIEVTVLPPKVPIPVSMTDVTPFKTNVIPWDYTAEARRKGKTYTGEAIAAQGMTRTGRVYTPEHLAESSKQASGRVVETGPDDLWRKVEAKEYLVVEQLNKTPAQISILALLQSSEAHKNALMKILSEAYVPSNITGGEMANMVGQVLESHKITFHEDELPPEGLGHNKALHITAQCEDHFITRILVDGGSSLIICPLITLRTLGKGLHEVKDGAISVKAFDGYQRSTIGEISLCLQMGPT
ncbi:uncharacterized protein [Nicotiana sylvestris]|uniref:uncharacterized protein n=1 Tax=Nicotiana sylvestris TaxID=4096 RepID=UPI00388C9771